jgi:hypothetical protein
MRVPEFKQGLWGTAMFLASGLAALVAAFFAVGFGNALTSTGGFTISDELAAAVIAVPLGAAWVIRHIPLPSFGQRRLTKWTTRIGFTALVAAGVAAKLIYESSGPLRETVGIWETLTGWADGDNWSGLGGVLDSPSELWDAIKRN